MLKTMTRDFLNFAQTNPLYLVCSVIYYVLGAFMLAGVHWIGFLFSAVFYAGSLAIVFSPAGEKLLRLLEHVRKLETKQEKEFLQPLFNEVYEQAKRRNPELGHIEMCVVDKIAVNAYALGKHTIAVTKGAMQTFNEEHIKALLAHEIAHILYHDTIASLYIWIAHGAFLGWVLTIKAILTVIDIVQEKYKKQSLGRAVTVLVKLIFEAIIFLFMLLMQIVVAVNSRKNEYRADRYAYDLGYGEELVEAFYLLEKIQLGDNSTIIQRMIRSHPRITARIEQLEILIDSQEAIQTAPVPLN